MKNVLDVSDIPLLQGIGGILTFVLNTVAFLLSYAFMVVDIIVAVFNYIYAFMIKSLTMLPFPVNIFIFYFFISLIPLTLIILILVMMHHAFTHESFGKDKMTISPLYILTPSAEAEPVKYPNQACENFAHSILLWIVFLHIFIFITVIF